MELMHPQCAGLDVHQHTVVACARVVAGSSVTHDVRKLRHDHPGAVGAQRLAHRPRLHPRGDGIDGRVLETRWHVLEGHVELVLANAMHIRNIPGRKSDVNDATWIADLLAHGLIRGSFVPPAPIQELRDLTRTRKQLVREITQHTLRIQKTLETANLKLTGVLTDILA